MSDYAHVKRILLEALERPEEARAAFLDEACGSDEKIRRRVERLLAAEDDAPEVLAPGGAPAVLGGMPHVLDGASGVQDPPDPASLSIPGYRILERLGEGGMGVVYEAEQEHPRRRVAIKIIRGGGFVSDLQVRLFQREAEALARLKHPSIAAIHEAGRTEDGHHFFAMELVHGDSLTHYARQLPLEGANLRAHLRARIEVFLRVCDAIAYAHQRGVIHRDLKPTNILVDARGVSRESTTARRGPSSLPGFDVKVLDFGLARINDPELQASVLLSTPGSVQGTLAYMSPEQARGRPEDIDIRTDLYSLGVLLYELLTDRLPIDVDGKPLHEAVRLVCESDPSPASTVRGELKGDLETIAQKALEKNPERRYQSATAIAEDIERHLADQPILARPPSATYQLKKLVTRHKGPVIFAASLFALAVVSAITLTFLWQEQRIATRRAETAEQVQTERLWEAYLAQARASRWSGRIGRRADALEALAAAAKIRPSLELRNEAIACLVLSDLEPDPHEVEWGYYLGDSNIHFDADLTRYAETEEDGGVAIKETATGREVARIPKMNGPAHFVRFDPRGRYHAARYVEEPSGGRGRSYMFRLWDTEESELLLEWTTGPDQAMAFSDDGTLFTSDVQGSTMVVYDLSARKIRHKWEAGLLPLAMDFDQENRRLVIGGTSGVEIYDMEQQQTVQRMTIEKSAYSVDWSPDGTKIVAAGSDFDVHLYDAATGKEIRTFQGHQAQVPRVVFHPRGQLIISSSWDGTTRFWSVQDGKTTFLVPIRFDQFSRDGSRIVLRSRGQVFIHDLTGRRGFQTFYGHEPIAKRTGTLSFSPDGRWLASGGPDGVRVWDAVTSTPIGHLPTGSTITVRFGADGSTLFTGGDAGVKKWLVRENADRLSFELLTVLFEEPVYDMDITRDENTVAILSPERQLLVRNLTDQTTIDLGQVSASRSTISGNGAWTADGSLHASSMTVWHTGTGEPAAVIPLEGGSDGHFDPTGRWFLASGRKVHRIYDVATWTEQAAIARYGKHASLIGRAAFAPDGDWAAATDGNSTIRLFSVPDGKELATLEAPNSELISRMAFSPDGSRLAVGCESGVVQVWEFDTIRGELAEMGLDW